MSPFTVLPPNTFSVSALLDSSTSPCSRPWLWLLIVVPVVGVAVSPVRSTEAKPPWIVPLLLIPPEIDAPTTRMPRSCVPPVPMIVPVLLIAPMNVPGNE